MWSLGALLELESRDKLEAFMRSHESKLDLPEIPKGLTQTMYEFYVTDYGKHSDLRLKQNNIFFNGIEINSIKSSMGNVKPIVNNIIANTIFKVHLWKQD